jgi:uncharacterized protein (TIGR03118 family)
MSGFAVAGPLLITVGLTLAPRLSAQHYVQQNLASDLAHPAGGDPKIVDANLVNPWGVAYSPTGPFWVSNQGTGIATIYSVNGITGAITKALLMVHISASLVGAPPGPTGQIFNPTANFVVTDGTHSGAALFLFSALNGTISGWSPGVPPPLSTVAQLAVTGAPAPVIYTGLAMATRGTDPFLYAANGAAKRVDVFNKNFVQVSLPGSFNDPDLPSGDVPFNIVNLGGKLFVTYEGPTGVVNIFDTDGNLLKRFATGGTLLNPWGIALAPQHFGALSNALLIGNFNHSRIGPNGAGWISGFDANTGEFRGLMEDRGTPVAIDGLWSLKFGNGGQGGIPDVLYFSAGIGSAPGVALETHGLFGSLSWQPPN